MTAADGFTFQVFYGKGVLTSYYSMTPGVTFTIDDTITTGYNPGAGHGPGGYFINVDQILPNWVEGDTFTFGYQVITPGWYGVGVSALWQENANIEPMMNAPLPSQSVGMAIGIPEPSTFALVALGAVSLLISRRRT